MACTYFPLSPFWNFAASPTTVPQMEPLLYSHNGRNAVQAPNRQASVSFARWFDWQRDSLHQSTARFWTGSPAVQAKAGPLSRATPPLIINGGDPRVPHFTRFNAYSGIKRLKISFLHLCLLGPASLFEPGDALSEPNLLLLERESFRRWCAHAVLIA